MPNSTPNYFYKSKNLHDKGGSTSDSALQGLFSPKRSTVNNILAYSKALEVKSAESGNKVLVVLN